MLVCRGQMRKKREEKLIFLLSVMRIDSLLLIHDIDADEDITLVNDQDDADMFDVNNLTGDEVLAEQEVVAKDVNLTIDEVTLAQALTALKSVKPKVKANVVESHVYHCYIYNNNNSSQPTQQKFRNKVKGILGIITCEPKKRRSNQSLLKKIAFKVHSCKYGSQQGQRRAMKSDMGYPKVDCGV
ncbi:hypothetical protein Tco_0537761 [Tanacetum coccineum]